MAQIGFECKMAKKQVCYMILVKLYICMYWKPPQCYFGNAMAEKFGENLKVCNAIGSALIDEMEMKFLISPIVQGL